MTPQTDTPSGLSQFFAEMRRRHVVRFSFGYAAAAFVLLQLAEIIFPAFGLEEVWLRVMVIAVALAFPPAVVLAWVFDLTPEGLKRTEDLSAEGSVRAPQAALTARIALVVVTFVIVGVVWVTLVDQGALTANLDGGSRSPSEVALTVYDPAEPVTSVAVLPLDDFTEGGGQAYFTSGMQEELITQLSQISGLRVVSRTSVAQFAGTNTPVPTIGRQLGVDAVIEGSVVRVEDRVRITVQLIHASSDTHIWSERFDRDLTDVLTLQTEVAYEIVRAIQGELTPEDESRLRLAAGKNVDPEAQDAYLRGKAEYDRATPEGYMAAMQLFEESVQADPDFAPGLAGLAGTRFLVTMDDPEMPVAELERAYGEATRAFALDSTSQEAREVLALIEKNIDDIMPSHAAAPTQRVQNPTVTRVISVPGMEDSLVINIESFDSAWVGAMTRIGSALEVRMHRDDAERGEIEGQTQRLFAARRLMAQGHFSAATGMLEDLVGDMPEMVPAWEMLVQSEVSTEDAPEIVTVLRSWQESGAVGAPEAAALESLEAAVSADGMRGYWSWNLQRLQERSDAGQEVSAVELASAYAGLGQDDQALELLAEGLRSGDRGLLVIQADPVWDDLRRDPRFQEIARQARALRFAPTTRRPGGSPR